MRILAETTKRAVRPDRGAFRLLVIVTAASLIFWNAPIVGWLLEPIKILITTLHELGHAAACLATGGSVVGLTIVDDKAGHAGLTMCKGGMPLVFVQAGYLGTALFGCLFIFLGRSPRLSKGVLTALGVIVCLASVLLMGAAAWRPGFFMQAVASLVWGLTIGTGLVWCGVKLSARNAQVLLLFLAVQTALNALTDVGALVRLSAGVGPSPSFSDATRMADLTGVPALVWSLSWAGEAVVILAFTVWWCFLRRGAAATGE